MEVPRYQNISNRKVPALYWFFDFKIKENKAILKIS